MNRRRQIYDRRTDDRHGFTVLEAIVGISMLSAFSLMLIPMLQRQASWRQELRRTQVAQYYLQNCAEALLSTTSGETGDDATSKGIESRLALDEETLKVLPQGKLEAEVKTEGDASHVRLRVRWHSHSEGTSSKVELHLWLPSGGGA